MENLDTFHFRLDLFLTLDLLPARDVFTIVVKIATNSFDSSAKSLSLSAGTTSVFIKSRSQ